MKSFSDDINKETNLPEIPKNLSVKAFSDSITYGVPDEFGMLETMLKLFNLHSGRKGPVYTNSPVQPGGGIREEAWDERVAKVVETLKKENPVELKYLDSARVNSSIAHLGAAMATGASGDFSFQNMLLYEMGYSRNDILKAQNIKGGKGIGDEERKGIPPWGVTRWEVTNLVQKSGWSVNQALRYLKEHKGIWKKQTDVIIKGRKAYTPEGVEIKGEYYHRDVGWY